MNTVEKTVSRIIQESFTQINQPILIAAGGPGGTGKSTFCQKLTKCLPESTILSLDHYKTPRKNRYHNNLYGAHPKANKIDLLKEHLLLIKENKSFQRPIYDNISGEINSSILYQPTRFNIIDGEISTYEEFMDLIDFSIFIDSHWKTQLNTRITRDINERNYSPEKAISTFLFSNLREFKKFGAHTKAWADIILFCNADYSLKIEEISSSKLSDNRMQDFST